MRREREESWRKREGNEKKRDKARKIDKETKRKGRKREKNQLRYGSKRDERRTREAHWRQIGETWRKETETRNGRKRENKCGQTEVNETKEEKREKRRRKTWSNENKTRRNLKWKRKAIRRIKQGETWRKEKIRINLNGT